MVVFVGGVAHRSCGVVVVIVCFDVCGFVGFCGCYC